MRRAFTSLAYLLAALIPFATASAAELTAIADANTDKAAPNTNLGSNGVLAVSTGRVTLIQFSPAQVSQSAGINGTLKVRVVLTKNSANTVDAVLVTSPWSEKTVTAATLPSLGRLLDEKTLTAADQGKPVSFDISFAITEWKANPAANFGIALVAATPAPNVQLGSREGGNAASLLIDGPANANQVTVARSGGDYSDPIKAADEALSWCRPVPLQAANCVMHIAAGTYILSRTLLIPGFIQVIGESRDDTRLVAAKGVKLAVNAGIGQNISDLTIMNLQDGLDAVEGISFAQNTTLESDVFSPITRVNIIVGGGKQNTGVIADETIGAGFEDVLVSVRGPGGGTGFFGTRPAGFKNATIEVIGADGAVAYRYHEVNLAGVGLEHSHLIAQGRNGANALSLTVGSEVIIKDCEIRASSAQGSATGIAGGGGNSDTPLTVLNSTITADAPLQGVGIDMGNWQHDVMLDGVQITASTTGLITSGFGAPSNIMRSQLNAGQVAIQTVGPDTLDVSDSGLRAPKWLVGATGATHFTDAILDGALQAGSTPPVCTRVYDRAYHLLPATCPQ